jgi:hypothetical protein
MSHFAHGPMWGAMQSHASYANDKTRRYPAPSQPKVSVVQSISDDWELVDENVAVKEEALLPPKSIAKADNPFATPLVQGLLAVAPLSGAANSSQKTQATHFFLKQEEDARLPKPCLFYAEADDIEVQDTFSRKAILPRQPPRKSQVTVEWAQSVFLKAQLSNPNPHNS